MDARAMSREPGEQARRRRAIATGLTLAAAAVGIYAYVLLHYFLP